MTWIPRPVRARLAALLALPALAAAPAGLAPAPATAETAAPAPQAEARRSRAALLPGWQAEDGTRMAGLRIGLDPGWKTYWRVPGDAGIPPRFDWTGSRNIADLRVRWPRPESFESFGMTTLGYVSDVVLPLEITPEDPDAPIRLRLAFAYGVCEEICIPEHARLSLDLPAGAQGGAQAVAAALDRLPRRAEAVGARMARCALERTEGGGRLSAVLELPGPPDPRALAVVEAPAPLWFAPAELAARGARAEVSARLETAGPGWADRGAIRVTLIEPDRATVFRGCPD